MTESKLEALEALSDRIASYNNDTLSPGLRLEVGAAAASLPALLQEIRRLQGAVLGEQVKRDQLLEQASRPVIDAAGLEINHGIIRLGDKNSSGAIAFEARETTTKNDYVEVTDASGGPSVHILRETTITIHGRLLGSTFTGRG